MSSYDYDDLDRRTRQTRVDSSFVDYGYDPQGQLQSAVGKESGGTTNRWHEQLGYKYDAAGNLNYLTNNVLLQTFSANTLNELSTVSESGTLTVAGTTTSGATNVTVAANGGGASNAIRYADATFARTNVSQLDGTNTFTAVAQDSLGRGDTNTVSSYLPTAVTFLYDLNGNLRTNGTRVFQYDDENQLICITEPGAWMSTNIYDGKMRRRIRKEYTWQNSAWVLSTEVRYVYDGNLLIQERDSFNVPRVTYTRGLDLSVTLERAGGIGGLLARSDASALNVTHAYYHADGNGNVIALVDALQKVVARYLYDPFGNTLSASGPMAEANLYRFSSKEWHPASGLVYYLYRFYDPNLQRWPNRDPIHEIAGLMSERKLRTFAAAGWNFYRFVRNNPPSYVDLLGLQEVAPPPVPKPGGPPAPPDGGGGGGSGDRCAELAAQIADAAAALAENPFDILAGADLAAASAEYERLNCQPPLPKLVPPRCPPEEPKPPKPPEPRLRWPRIPPIPPLLIEPWIVPDWMLGGGPVREA